MLFEGMSVHKLVFYKPGRNGKHTRQRGWLPVGRLHLFSFVNSTSTLRAEILRKFATAENKSLVILKDVTRLHCIPLYSFI